MTSNSALADELEAVNSIYDEETLVITSRDDISTATVLKLPDSPFSFSITFPHDYPDVPPQIVGTQSTGSHTKKGDGEAALNVLRGVFGDVYTPGQVCLFDLIEEVAPLLRESRQDEQGPADSELTGHQHYQRNGSSQDLHDLSLHGLDGAATGEPEIASLNIKSLSDVLPTGTATPQTPTPEPQWSLSQPMLVSKSSFIARALSVDSVAAATNAIQHLLSTNKKVASATHNITAWRIRSRRDASAPEIVVQDCDDNGETAAGGRLLHLLQLMDVWNVVVVVTRWYGGVKLGPDRFRCINMVARDALVRGGFVKEEAEGGEKGKGKGGRKK